MEQPRKPKEHKIDPTDIELSDWEFRLVMGDSWGDRHIYLNSIFCSCGAPEKTLIDFKVYLNDLNDLVLRGLCSGCHTIAARYIETGENADNSTVAERIRKAKSH